MSARRQYDQSECGIKSISMVLVDMSVSNCKYRKIPAQNNRKTPKSTLSQHTNSSNQEENTEFKKRQKEEN